MRSLIEQLESNEAVLLMYLADELPASDRTRIEQRLAAEPALRDELDRLREMHASLDAAMRQLDSTAPLPGSESASVRTAGRAIRQWHADRAAAAARPAAPPQTLRFPWWSYPLAAAAAITLAFATWFYRVADVAPTLNGEIAMVDREDSDVEHRVPGVGLAEQMFALADPPLLEDPHDLSELERELHAVREMRDWLQ